MADQTTLRRLTVFQSEAAQCTSCHDFGLVHIDEHHGVAKPMLQKMPTGALGLLIVAEAPNWEDTYDPAKGHLTYDKDTDPTGRFIHALLTEEVGLTNAEVNDVLFTNAALCLPAEENGKHRVPRKQLDLCSPWLVRLIEDANVRVVITMGATPLRALNRIERHRLTLRTGVGVLHDWFGRKLLPLYHPGLLGRVTRKAEQQRQDIRVLREVIERA
jgi:uracil-DNA glycosylase